MASVLSPAALPDVSTPVGPPPTRRWLVGPWFDGLLLANVAWPLALLWQGTEVLGGRAGLQFWQVYYVTTPHRWVTLLLVFLDRERLSARRGVFLAITGVVVACAWACVSPRAR